MAVIDEDTKATIVKLKWLLYIGIVLVVSGIVLKKMLLLGSLPILLLILGGSMKLLFLILSWRNGSFRPGYEMLLLVFGLGLFFTGLYVKHPVVVDYKSFFLPSGVFLKLLFIILIIRKKYKNKGLSKE